MNILEEIVAHKRKEVAAQKSLVPVADLMKKAAFTDECYPFASFIRDPMRSSIIAEFKRKSPSKGWINQEARVGMVTRGYTSFGAAALSVLTDQHFFGGSLDDLEIARENQIPILRKDFIVDDYQLLEAKAYGADVILLIAACLDKQEVKDLSHTAKNLGLNVLLEIHSEAELETICDSIDVIGINNRNLKTFQVDIENSMRLASQLPDKCKISESGIDTPETLKTLRAAGFEGFLMGERFMKEKFPAVAFKNFLKSCNED
ncbi:MAG: indole-3-glycerol phosphate synthase TrpC [Chitinophagaceae bacterium]|nr:indole-3-glycerol phosphate synthase TrpC [Chitinophagaceae bacterium]MCW5913991.1 indole-3-glycerol phosphate synthase TrpC [Chitinophagaceae bacterium]MCZ2395971.1 indole-3-glycerol phosphate synthase TrpC [Chitinophagales bacterium]